MGDIPKDERMDDRDAERCRWFPGAKLFREVCPSSGVLPLWLDKEETEEASSSAEEKKLDDVEDLFLRGRTGSGFPGNSVRSLL